MRICGTFDGQDFSEDVNWLDLEETTSADLFSLVKQKAALRANVALVEVLLVFQGRPLPVAATSLSSLGITPACTVRALCYDASPARFECCEPSLGPENGGNVVHVHGTGFLVARGFGSPHLHIAFGAERVPCKRVSDKVLLCSAPPHAPGPVLVTLGSCYQDQALGHGPGRYGAISAPEEDCSGATYEYVERGAMYDAIFASTNSHCPLRSRANEHDVDALRDIASRWAPL